MLIVTEPQELIDSSLYLDVERVFGRKMYVKVEGLNFGGSVKMRAAAAMVSAAEQGERIKPGSILIESSSGNLGVALSAIAASKGLPFVCVTDRRCNRQAAATMRAFGAELVVIEEPDPQGGLLGARLAWVRRHCAADDRYVWLNQYTNETNWRAHYERTGPGIAKDFPDLDVLFVGVGTGGTAVGCGRYLRESGSATRVVAVDAVGSVSFGSPPAERLIPGLGAGVRPPLLDPTLFDDVVLVPELDTVLACRMLSSRGLLFGGSTGTVLSGACRWLERHDPSGGMSAICIAPDMGDRYLDTLYDDAWVVDHFGERALPQPQDRRRAW